MSTFRPLLAATIEGNGDLEKLNYPLLGSPKLDGFRVLIHPTEGPITRSFKKVPNHHIYDTLNKPEFYGLDGEITVGPIFASDVFARTISAGMSHDGTPDFCYNVFDNFQVDEGFRNRLRSVQLGTYPQFVRFLDHTHILDYQDALVVEEHFLTQGFEGMMLRKIDGKYKFGRSTLKEQILLKLKRWTDDEATIIGFEELYHNTNEQVRDAFGLAERSSHRAGQVAAGTLGALLVDHRSFGQFSIGSGLDHTLRKQIWERQASYLGKQVTFKYQAVGVVDKPRFPIFLRFRPEE